MKEVFTVTVQVTPFKVIGSPDPDQFSWALLPIIGKHGALRTYVNRVAKQLATSGKVGTHRAGGTEVVTAIVERGQGGVEFAFEVVALSLAEVVAHAHSHVIGVVEWGRSLDEIVINELELWVSDRTDLADPYCLYYTENGHIHWFTMSSNALAPNGVNQYGGDLRPGSKAWATAHEQPADWATVPADVLDAIVLRLDMEA